MSSEVETPLSIEQQNNEGLRSLLLLVLSSGARSPTGVPVATALCRRVCARDASTEQISYKPLDRSCLLSSSIGRVTGLAVCAAARLFVMLPGESVLWRIEHYARPARPETSLTLALPENRENSERFLDYARNDRMRY
jgi:hypothetical protein